jgi:hypothetical protein
MPIDCSCRHCGKAFQVRPYQVKKGGGKFCSRRCLMLGSPSIEEARLKSIRGKEAHNSAGLTKRCLRCGKDFRISPSRSEIKKYCGQKCYGEAQRVNNTTKYRRIIVEGKQVLEHRWLMQQHAGRPLRDDEEVDHKNGNRGDNRIDNLRILEKRDHSRISSYQRGIYQY